MIYFSLPLMVSSNDKKKTATSELIAKSSIHIRESKITSFSHKLIIYFYYCINRDLKELRIKVSL